MNPARLYRFMRTDAAECGIDAKEYFLTRLRVRHMSSRARHKRQRVHLYMTQSTAHLTPSTSFMPQRYNVFPTFRSKTPFFFHPYNSIDSFSESDVQQARHLFLKSLLRNYTLYTKNMPYSTICFGTAHPYAPAEGKPISPEPKRGHGLMVNSARPNTISKPRTGSYKPRRDSWEPPLGFYKPPCGFGFTA